MPFDWMHVDRTRGDSKSWQNQYLRGIRERAKLLYNLKFTSKRATQRIQSDLAWEFDNSIASTPLPSFYKQVPKIVAAVYEHARAGQGAKAKKITKTGKKQ
jgi:hypothetical protein